MDQGDDRAGGRAGPHRRRAPAERRPVDRLADDVVGDEAWTVAFEAGSPTSVTDAGGAVPEPTAEAHVVTGSPAAWEALLSSPPPSGSTDFFAAAGTGAMTILPPPDDAGRHLALRRFGELLRHAANGTDPAPQPVPDQSRHGQHDAAVGRYVHLDLDGLDHRLYYESAGQGIGLLCQHTAGADGRQWRHLLEDRRVTDRFQVVVYDLPYHGKSLPPAGRAWWAEPYVLSQAWPWPCPSPWPRCSGWTGPCSSARRWAACSPSTWPATTLTTSEPSSPSKAASMPTSRSTSATSRRRRSPRPTRPAMPPR